MLADVDFNDLGAFSAASAMLCNCSMRTSTSATLMLLEENFLSSSMNLASEIATAVDEADDSEM